MTIGRQFRIQAMFTGHSILGNVEQRLKVVDLKSSLSVFVGFWGMQACSALGLSFK